MLSFPFRENLPSSGFLELEIFSSLIPIFKSFLKIWDNLFNHWRGLQSLFRREETDQKEKTAALKITIAVKTELY